MFLSLFCLQEGLKERELCVFFRNNHFNTMFKVLKSFSCDPNIDVTIVLSSDIYSVVSVQGSALFTCYRSGLHKSA